MKCEIDGCEKRPLYSPYGQVAVRCSMHRLDTDKQRYVSLCEICNDNTALFNFPGIKKGIRCAEHKENGMVPIRGSFCQECNITNPCYGFPLGKGTHCLTHRLEGQVNVQKKICEIDGCNITAKYNFSNIKKPLRCSSHKDDGMVIIYGKTCDLCGKIPSYGIIKPTRCLDHKENDMKELTSKKCEKCDNPALYGPSGTREKIFCKTHASEGMKLTTGPFCVVCNKMAFYGEKGGRPKFCPEHRQDGTINVLVKKCKDCDKMATFNFSGEKGSIYCAGHSLEGMISKTRLYCTTLHCGTRGYEKYNKLCYKCFVMTYPDAKTSRNWKTKERAVKDFLISKWPDSIITHDKAVDCFKFRPDFVIELGSHTIVVEVDEYQHKKYDTSCENKRLMSIFQGLGSRPMVMIRFNPDAYVDETGKRIKGCWQDSGLVIRGNEWERRLRKLEKKIIEWWDCIPEKEVTIEHLFFTSETRAEGQGQPGPPEAQTSAI